MVPETSASTSARPFCRIVALKFSLTPQPVLLSAGERLRFDVGAARISCPATKATGARSFRCRCPHTSRVTRCTMEQKLMSSCAKCWRGPRRRYLYPRRLHASYGPVSLCATAPSARSQAMTSSCPLRTAASKGVSSLCPTQFRSAPCARR
jgi:hypothetical protein